MWFPIIDRKPADVSAEHLPGDGGTGWRRGVRCRWSSR